MLAIRSYQPSDYARVAKLYKDSALYGGQFDEAKDSKERLDAVIAKDPEAILIAEKESEIVGTVSLIEDGRVAWLFRFAVMPGEDYEETVSLLYRRAEEIFKGRGHSQTLVYAPVGDMTFEERYRHILGFEHGSDYTCFWKNI